MKDPDTVGVGLAHALHFTRFESKHILCYTIKSFKSSNDNYHY